MISYGSFEIKTTATATRGLFRLSRGYRATIERQDEMTLLDNGISRLDSMIKTLVSGEIDRCLAIPKCGEPIAIQAHDTACVIKWPEWFTEAAPFARLCLLIDWRRALLEQKAIANERPQEKSKPIPLALLEKQRRDARERKKRSRERQRNAAKLAGTWKPPGRPRKATS